MAENPSIQFTIKVGPGKVRIQFGPVVVGLDPSTSREVGEAIIRAADSATELLIEEMPKQ